MHRTETNELVEPPLRVDEEGGEGAGLEVLEADLAGLECSVYHLVRSNVALAIRWDGH